jgi:heat shock protein HslJ
MHPIKNLLATAACLSLAGCASYPPLSESTWQLAQVSQNGASTPVRGEFTLVLGEDGAVTGNILCNQWFGQHSIDGKSLNITGTGASKKHCADRGAIDQRIERSYLDVLETGLQRTGPDQLTTKDSAGLTWIFKRQ